MKSRVVKGLEGLHGEEGERHPGAALDPGPTVNRK